MRIINLTQHAATPEQVAAGVVEPLDKQAVARLLTFDSLPTRAEIEARAEALATLAVGESQRDASGDWPEVLIGGAPFFMAPLERALLAARLQAVHAFSLRQSAEEKQADGSVRKVAVFRHVGFISAEVV
jgi:hypothetical protein